MAIVNLNLHINVSLSFVMKLGSVRSIGNMRISDTVNMAKCVKRVLMKSVRAVIEIFCGLFETSFALRLTKRKVEMFASANSTSRFDV